jgi:hypothetical protein
MCAAGWSSSNCAGPRRDSLSTHEIGAPIAPVLGILKLTGFRVG